MEPLELFFTRITFTNIKLLETSSVSNVEKREFHQHFHVPHFSKIETKSRYRFTKLPILFLRWLLEIFFCIWLALDGILFCRGTKKNRILFYSYEITSSPKRTLEPCRAISHPRYKSNCRFYACNVFFENISSESSMGFFCFDIFKVG